MSAGMLYGHEVEKPKEFEQRKRDYRAQKRRTSPKRNEVYERMSRGMGFKEIALELGTTMRSVYMHSDKLYRKHGVHSRVELARACGWTAAQPRGEIGPRRERVLELLAEGRKAPGIARMLGIAVGTIHSDVEWWYRKYGVSRRGELMEALKKREELRKESEREQAETAEGAEAARSEADGRGAGREENPIANETALRD